MNGDHDTYAPQRGLVASRAASPAPAAARPGNLAALIARIEEAIETETNGIRSDVHFDLKSSNARKSRCLYELNRALKDQRGGDLGQHREALTRLRRKLEDNEAAIRAHLSAVNEVAALLRDAIQRSEADGTYSSSAFSGGSAP